MRNHGATTHPESVTGGRAGPAGVLAVRWVVPTPWTTPIPPAGALGRDPACEIVLSGHDVSRRHAEIRRVGLLPLVRDLGSRNGTWVNGLKIEDRPLGPNDVLRIGEWVGIVVELERDSLSSAGFMELANGWFGGRALANAIDPARRAAESDLPIIVQGETGTGKEGMARAVHGWSRRRGAFIGVNCATIPAAMAEGELFGYRKGAFTGADRANEGFFRAAEGGTLFLDEILDLPPAVQTKLLRVLEQREVQPLGDARPVRVDVRLVCATQEPLAQAVAEKRFRADLFARLDGVTVVLPPLRERREDIAPLFLRLVHDMSGGRAPAVDPKLIESLLLYDWPLNVRELVLLTRRMLVLHGAESGLKRSMLPERMTATGAGAATEDSEFNDFLNALRATRGNVTHAAAALGISRAKAYRLLEARPGFDIDSLRGEDER